MDQELATVTHLRQCVFDDVYKASGLPSSRWLRRLLETVLRSPAQKFAQIADSFDTRVAQSGFREAARVLLPHFLRCVEVHGADSIPSEGPLLIAANHPGLYDGLMIAAALPRSDLKIVATGLSFIQNLPFTGNYLIYFNKELSNRMLVLRAAVRHLREGGALLLFPSGRIDPDPDVFTNARQALASWSPSLGFLMEKVQETRLVLSIVSGILDPSFLRHPLVRRRSGWLERQKWAEFIQIVLQILRSQRSVLEPRVTFSQPFTIQDLSAMLDRGGDILPQIVSKAQALLSDHMSPIASQTNQ